MFVEFPGVYSPVFINADCIAQIVIGGSFKDGYEGLIDEFYVDEEDVGVFMRVVRDTITTSQ